MRRGATCLVAVLTTDLLAGCYSMNFSDYKGDAGSAGATGTSEAGEVAGSQLDAGPDSNGVSPDLTLAPDRFAPGSIDLAMPKDLVGPSRDLAQDLPSGGPDVMAPDAKPEPDAAADADTDAGIQCGSGAPPLFTDSFDQSSLVAAGWTTVLQGGGMFSLDNSAYASGPASALMSLPETSMSTPLSMCSAGLSMLFPPPHAPTVHLAFDMRVSGSCLQSELPGAFLVLPRVMASVSPASAYHLDIYVDASAATTAYVHEGDSAGNSYAPAARQSIKLDEWQHIDLQLRFSGQQPTGSLSVGDGPAQVFALHPTGSAIYGDQSVFLSFGTICFVPPSPACNVNYDNVVFDMPAACTILPSGPPDEMAPDAGPGLDAATDADAAPILCGSGAPLFTDSFDKSPLVAAGGWTTYLTGGGAMLLDQSTYSSSPASALSSLPVTTQQGSCAADLSMSFMQIPHAPTAHLAFDVRISGACLQSLTPGSFLSIADLSPAPTHLLGLYVQTGMGTTIYMNESTGPTVRYPAAGRQYIKLDEWQHVDLQLRFSGQPMGSLSVGDGPAQFFTPHPTASVVYSEQPAFLSLGALLMGPAPACTVNYDNVVFDMPAACTN
ncbi:MAG TPA: hypothetical protein VJ860_17150 [Polyangia bacterium]|jgi:hypothetical protein|nr:hypothetical protein [Polyangia bacterium]